MAFIAHPCAGLANNLRAFTARWAFRLLFILHFDIFDLLVLFFEVFHQARLAVACLMRVLLLIRNVFNVGLIGVRPLLFWSTRLLLLNGNIKVFVEMIDIILINRL